MALSFGTSGLRGLVVDLTDEAVAAYSRAFLTACPPDGPLYIGRDLRPSSPRIAAAVAAAAAQAGCDTVDCGALPTPALALVANAASAPAVMVTGSHIPADRNGLKFYTAAGEISKADEATIQAAFIAGPGADSASGQSETRDTALATYAARYTDAFGATSLSGLRIGVYQHSSVAREILPEILSALGADPVALAPSESFIPVDTEAVDPATRRMLRAWCTDLGLDGVVSTDGDADRPMLTDGTGSVIAGDILGVLTAQFLGADHVCTPVSSNSMVETLFETVDLTRIGSPYVVAAIEAALAANPAAKVVGFEANGGFLVGFTAAGPTGNILPLMTRDSVLPIVAPLAAAKAKGVTLANLVAQLPPRFTAADRVQEIDPAKAKAFLTGLINDPAAQAAFFAANGDITRIDQTDGLRVTFETGDVVHLRPSGNAPEFRVYSEASSVERAEANVQSYLQAVANKLSARPAGRA